MALLADRHWQGCRHEFIPGPHAHEITLDEGPWRCQQSSLRSRKTPEERRVPLLYLYREKTVCFFSRLCNTA